LFISNVVHDFYGYFEPNLLNMNGFVCNSWVWSALRISFRAWRCIYVARGYVFLWD